MGCGDGPLQLRCPLPPLALTSAARPPLSPSQCSTCRQSSPHSAMLLSNGILTNEVLRWKTIGAAVWLAAVAVAISAAWSLAAAPTTLLSPLRLLSGLFSPTGWLGAAALVLAQAPAFVAQVGALRSSDPKPIHAHRLPRLGAAAVVASKLAARCSSALGAARTATFLGLHVLSAMMFLGIDSATRSAAPQGAQWGAAGSIATQVVRHCCCHVPSRAGMHGVFS